MARLARIVIPDVPHHVVQRARPGIRLFADDSDYAEYRDMLERNLRGARLVSACLMPDHVHLIAIPSTSEALARMLGETRRLYARYKGLGAQGLVARQISLLSARCRACQSGARLSELQPGARRARAPSLGVEVAPGRAGFRRARR